MARLYHGFWAVFTVVLCVIFSVLFFPVVRQKYGLLQSAALTLAGVIVIWIVYFTRAALFSRMVENQKEK